jgi:hypothetical protein
MGDVKRGWATRLAGWSRGEGGRRRPYPLRTDLVTRGSREDWRGLRRK